MATGKIARIYPDKGYGFLKDDLTHEDCFFHRSAALDGLEALKPGDRVSFEPTATDRGPRAECVELCR